MQGKGLVVIDSLSTVGGGAILSILRGKKSVLFHQLVVLKIQPHSQSAPFIQSPEGVSIRHVCSSDLIAVHETPEA